MIDSSWRRPNNETVATAAALFVVVIGRAEPFLFLHQARRKRPLLPHSLVHPIRPTRCRYGIKAGSSQVRGSRLGGIALQTYMRAGLSYPPSPMRGESRRPCSSPNKKVNLRMSCSRWCKKYEFDGRRYGRLRTFEAVGLPNERCQGLNYNPASSQRQ